MQAAVNSSRAALVLFIEAGEAGEAAENAALTAGLPLFADDSNVTIYGVRK